MRVRAWREGDEAGVVDVVREVYVEYGFTWDPEGYHADLYDLAAHFAPPAGQLFVAEGADSGLCACGGITLHPPQPGAGLLAPGDGLPRVAGTDCELHRVYVRPAVRRRGLGRALTLACADWARAMGATSMEIWSDQRFEAAHRLYESLGAVQVGERICDDPDVSPEWGYRWEF